MLAKLIDPAVCLHCLAEHSGLLCPLPVFSHLAFRSVANPLLEKHGMVRRDGACDTAHVQNTPCLSGTIGDFCGSSPVDMAFGKGMIHSPEIL